MTNCVFFASAPLASEKVLVRIYGTCADQFVQREREMFWLCRLSELGIGPRLLGAFSNGRCEQYLDSTTLTKHDIRSPTTSPLIARALSRVHGLIRSCDPDQASAPELWDRMRAWYRLATKAAADFSPEQQARIAAAGVEVDALGREIERLQRELVGGGEGPTLVFAHNDAQYGNILQMRSDGSIIVVDYEYSGVNYRGFDIGNHFCEWAADYHSPTPHEMNFTHYPTPSEQHTFLDAYLSAQIESGAIPPPADRESLINLLARESTRFALCSHLLWGLWGLMQARQSEMISFDYLGYAVQRLGEYFRTRDAVLGL
ncbi:kinase-like domain-containing protein [Blyttiomyces helicus]|uniref:Kinase-like domain-containing protein n=1 Tax=Blyttiomyces helicus TaxID=388810 RepID=A0A4P9W495_9FUNG|nr:kinase-like domain-containing protein [Blyttiomyces helicus]|eukprot:RKO85668.1 kinase-like domain-containing protein [Blyttiomyces helicus]